MLLDATLIPKREGGVKGFLVVSLIGAVLSGCGLARQYEAQAQAEELRERTVAAGFAHV
jgi:hypothetical protein